MNINKFVFSAALFLTASASVSAFERDVLMEGTSSKNGGFFGLTSTNAHINGNVEQMVGGRGGWIIDHHTYVGIAGYDTVSNLENTELQVNYGGFIAGYIFKPERFVHYNLELLVGAGEIEDQTSNKSDVYAVVEPAANISISLTENADLSFGISYRVMTGTDQAEISDSDFSGWSAKTSLVFGYF